MVQNIPTYKKNLQQYQRSKHLKYDTTELRGAFKTDMPIFNCHCCLRKPYVKQAYSKSKTTRRLPYAIIFCPWCRQRTGWFLPWRKKQTIGTWNGYQERKQKLNRGVPGKFYHYLAYPR